MADPFASEVTADRMFTQEPLCKPSFFCFFLWQAVAFAQPATDPFAAPSESTSQDQTPVSVLIPLLWFPLTNQDLIFDAPAPEAPQEQLSPFEAQPQPPVPVEEEPMTVPEPVYVEVSHHYLPISLSIFTTLSFNVAVSDLLFSHSTIMCRTTPTTRRRVG